MSNSTKIKWDDMIKSLSQSAAKLDASSFLHHCWLSRFDYTPERTLFEKVKSHVKKANASVFLTGTAADVETYRRIFEPTISRGKRRRTRFEILSLR